MLRNAFKKDAKKEASDSDFWSAFSESLDDVTSTVPLRSSGLVHPQNAPTRIMDKKSREKKFIASATG